MPRRTVDYGYEPLPLKAAKEIERCLSGRSQSLSETTHLINHLEKLLPNPKRESPTDRMWRAVLEDFNSKKHYDDREKLAADARTVVNELKKVRDRKFGANLMRASEFCTTLNAHNADRVMNL